MALVLVGHPFDTMKVRLQIEGKNGRFTGVMHCIGQTFKKEGVRGFYKGLTPPLFATGAVNSVMFGLQGLTLHFFKRGDPTRQSTVKETAVAAIFSGAAISLLVTPMEGIKSRLQIQYAAGGLVQYHGPIDCARHVISSLGIRNGLYRGWSAVAFCRMSNWSYFGSYELFRQLLSKPHPQRTQPEARSLSFGANVLAGGLAGTCYWLSCYPLDVVKARILAAPDVAPPKYKGVIDAARTIYRKEGWRAFFAGFSPCVIRAFPANAACFVAFEQIMSILPE